MSDLIMKVKRNSAGAPDFSTAVEIEPKEYDPYGTCKHNGKSWHEEPCDGCCGNHSGYEPIGDLISRQDAIEAIEELPNAYNGWSDAYDKACIIGALEEVPSAEPKTEWIPVSDIRKLEGILLMKINSFEGTRNIVEKGMLEVWKEVVEYIDGMLGEDGEA